MRQTPRIKVEEVLKENVQLKKQIKEMETARKGWIKVDEYDKRIEELKANYSKNLDQAYKTVKELREELEREKKWRQEVMDEQAEEVKKQKQIMENQLALIKGKGVAIDDLQKEIKELKEKNREQLHELADDEGKIMEKVGKVSAEWVEKEYKPKLKELEEKNKEIQSELNGIYNLSPKEIKGNTTFERIYNYLEIVVAKNKELDGKYNKLEQDNRTLKATLTTEQSIEKKLEGFIKERDEEIKTLEEGIVNCVGVKKMQTKQIKDRDKEIERLEEIKLEQTEKLTEAFQKSIKVQKEIDEKDEEIQELAEACSNTQEILKEEIKELRTEQKPIKLICRKCETPRDNNCEILKDTICEECRKKEVWKLENHPSDKVEEAVIRQKKIIEEKGELEVIKGMEEPKIDDTSATNG